MKKLNLLLATTAILSAGALMVNAAPGDETVVPVRAEIVHVHNLHATPIDFGRIAVDDGDYSNDDQVIVMMDSAGITTYIEGYGVPGYILSNGKKGTVTGTDCEHLDFNQHVEMSVPEGRDGEIKAHADLYCMTVDNEATFYGGFYININVNGEQVPAGNYTGSLTVTEINPEP